jgi:hypothetical protein
MGRHHVELACLVVGVSEHRETLQARLIARHETIALRENSSRVHEILGNTRDGKVCVAN